MNHKAVPFIKGFKNNSISVQSITGSLCDPVIVTSFAAFGLRFEIVLKGTISS